MIDNIKKSQNDSYITWLDLAKVLCTHNQSTLESVAELYLEISLFREIPVYSGDLHKCYINNHFNPDFHTKYLQEFINTSPLVDIVLSDDTYKNLTKADMKTLNSFFGQATVRLKSEDGSIYHQIYYSFFRKADLKTLPKLEQFLPSDFYDNLGLHDKPTFKMQNNEQKQAIEPKKEGEQIDLVFNHSTKTNQEGCDEINALQTQLDQAHARIAELESEQGINLTENPWFVLGAIMQTIKQTKKTNYTQASHYQFIIDNYEGMGLSPSNFEKTVSYAKNFFLQKVNKKSK